MSRKANRGMGVEHEFVHEGKPQVKERPRAGPNGRKLYTPSKTLDAQANLAAAYDGPTFEGLVRTWLEFHPTHTVIRIADYDGPPSPLRGDNDNYAKLVHDALEGVAYPNDRQIMWSQAAKCA